MPDPSAANPRKRSRSRSRSRSPPRQRKRPGASARPSAADRARVLERQAQRESEAEAEAARAAAERGSGDVVKQHYNAVPQRGREWRRTDSKIKNLRAYNNWAKSVLIHKFSPGEEFHSTDFSRNVGDLAVLDIGCGKGGDLGKWQKAPQRVGVYLGVDPAEVSIEQARERYGQQRHKSRGRIFEGHFVAKDGYGEWIGEIPLVKEIGVADPNGAGRWGGAGFDVVTMMFCMHYSFESEQKARGMLRNVATSLKKGGRWIGVIPDSDVIRAKVEEFYKIHPPQKEKADDSKTDGPTNGEAHGAGDASAKPDASSDPPASATDGAADQARTESVPPATASANADASGSSPPPVASAAAPHWGNSVYSLAFPATQPPPASGVFRPQYGWRYQFFLTEAVESVPEYVVPFEAFRGLAEEYNLELQYRKNFHEIFQEECRGELGHLAERMGVPRNIDGPDMVDEWEAIGFYVGFCFYKV